MTGAARTGGLFARFGIEIEYMIVDAGSLAVRPLADRLIEAASGAVANEIEQGAIAWSNELALHLVEVKTNGPAGSLDNLDKPFLESIQRANGLLAPFGARLLGSAMHPFMDPARETTLWPHGDNAIYRAFDRLFDSKRHGWANIQSTHLNLPFTNDDEFGRLHAAIRLVLPIIPALAAASPIYDGRPSGLCDARMEVYLANSSRVPSITAGVIPEPVFSVEEYKSAILDKIYRDLAPLDPDGTLCAEWVNARGAIARFERNAIEIRVIDAQETPGADLAVAAAVAGAAKLLADERFSSYDDQKRWDAAPLRNILGDAIRNGEATIIADSDYLRTLGMTGAPHSGWEVWRHLIETIGRFDPSMIAAHRERLEWILAEGTLATRIMRALGSDHSKKHIDRVYHRLADCLEAGTML
jgi:glutamate---cysteine ligase / carboxylate-amine ligase